MRSSNLVRSSLLSSLLVAAAPALAAAQGLDPLVPEDFKLLPEQGGPVYLFGTSVVVDGDTIAIGAPWDSSQVPTGGAVWVYRWNGTAWLLEARLASDDLAAVDHFGREVDLDGDTLIATAWRADAQAEDSGAAYVFVRDGATWTQQAKLTGSDSAQEDLFGSGLALQGDRVVVGAWWHDTDGLERAGKVYVFERTGVQWAEVQQLRARDATAQDQFGLSVALDGDRLAVGAWLDSTLDVASGAAYTFHRDPGTGSWSESQKLIPSNAGNASRCGRSLALDGDTLIVGRGDTNHPGAANVYVESASTWSERAILLPGEGAGGDQFGLSVGLRGDVAIVGAGAATTAIPGTGSAYRFVRTGSSWKRQARLVSTDAEAGDQLGVAVDFDGERVVVGANWSDDLGSQSGSAYVFGPHGPGANYCTVAVNSTGGAAWMSAAGSPSIATNDLQLRAFRMPPGQFALLVYGGAPAQIPLGEGTLCIAPFAPGLFRVLPVVQVGANGVATRALDLTALPQDGSIQVGETWYFQYWYRDGTGFNLSDGLQILFMP